MKPFFKKVFYVERPGPQTASLVGAGATARNSIQSGEEGRKWPCFSCPLPSSGTSAPCGEGTWKELKRAGFGQSPSTAAQVGNGAEMERQLRGGWGCIISGQVTQVLWGLRGSGPGGTYWTRDAKGRGGGLHLCIWNLPAYSGDQWMCSQGKCSCYLKEIFK